MMKSKGLVSDSSENPTQNDGSINQRSNRELLQAKIPTDPLAQAKAGRVGNLPPIKPNLKAPPGSRVVGSGENRANTESHLSIPHNPLDLGHTPQFNVPAEGTEKPYPGTIQREEEEESSRPRYIADEMVKQDCFDLGGHRNLGHDSGQENETDFHDYTLTVKLNDPDFNTDQNYPSNQSITTKYSLLTFLPGSLYIQLRNGKLLYFNYA